MFKINQENKSISITRGDRGIIKLSIPSTTNEEKYKFKLGDMIIFTVKPKKDCGGNFVIYKEVVIDEEDTTEATILLDSMDTKIGEQLSKPVTYWYEISLNGTNTILGYDEDGAKDFVLYPENGEDEEVLGDYVVEQELEGDVLITETKVLVNNKGNVVVKNLTVEEYSDGEVTISDDNMKGDEE